MTNPNDAAREPAIDPSDPRWVEDILERARRRAEQNRKSPGTAPADPAIIPPTGTAPADPAIIPPTGAAPADPATAPSAGEPRRTLPTPTAATPATAATAGGPAAPASGASDQPRRPAGPRPQGAPLPPAGDRQPPAGPAPRRRVEISPLDEATGVRPAGTGEPGDAARGDRAWAASAAGSATGATAPGATARRGGPTASVPRTVPPDTDPVFDLTETIIVSPADAGADDEREARALRSWLEWGAVVVGALVVAFLIRAVAFQAFYIPSESMEHTLEVKDRILVNKLSYRLHDVNRGDIIVFEKPPGETSRINDLIKRVIALPGETIEQQGKDIYIDRGQGPQKLTETYVSEPADMGPAISWVQGCANPSTETNRCEIPAGHVWVMGDNRGHSHDSRMFGPIDEDLIVGRAFVKVWPLGQLGFL